MYASPSQTCPSASRSRAILPRPWRRSRRAGGVGRASTSDGPAWTSSGAAREGVRGPGGSVSGSSMSAAKARMASAPAGRSSVPGRMLPVSGSSDHASRSNPRGAVETAGRVRYGASSSGGEVAAQIEPLDELHREVRVALVHARLEHADDVRVVEVPQRLELAGEAASGGGVARGGRPE